MQMYANFALPVPDVCLQYILGTCKLVNVEEVEVDAGDDSNDNDDNDAKYDDDDDGGVLVTTNLINLTLLIIQSIDHTLSLAPYSSRIR